MRILSLVSNTPPQAEGWPFGAFRSVVWREIDALGHAHHTAYWSWCEDLRNAHAVEIGLDRPGGAEPSQVLAACTAEYVLPLHLDDPLLVVTRSLRLGRTSHAAEYAVFGPAGLAFSAKCTLVLVEPKTGRPVPYPEKVRHRLAALDPECSVFSLTHP